MNKKGQMYQNPQVKGIQIPKDKSIPTGVKLIAVLEIIGAIILILAGILLIIIRFIPINPYEATPGGGISISFTSFILDFLSSSPYFLILSLILLPLGILSLFAGIYLWKGKNWARIVMISFSFLNILSIIILVILGKFDTALNNIPGASIGALIGFYLLLSKKVREAFS